MPRISMQQAYDNRDVIAQIYKMLADVADSVAKATEAVAKALEAMETAEDAGEAAEAAQQTADGKQDALTTEQLAAVDSGITAEDVTQIGTNATAIAGLDDRTEILASTEGASAGDVLMLDANKDPVWGEVLPDATSANAGDALVLNAAKEAIWDRISTDHIVCFIDSGFPSTGSVKVNGVSYTRRQFADALNDKTIDANRVIIIECYSNYYVGVGVLRYDDNGRVRATFAATGYNNNKMSCEYGDDQPMQNDGSFNTSGYRSVTVNPVPAATTADAGKILSVDSTGHMVWITPTP